jgi:antitoxin ParD1/3/4
MAAIAFSRIEHDNILSIRQNRATGKAEGFVARRRRSWYELVTPEPDSIVTPQARKRTFSLPSEHADFIDAKVASGDYASASEVVRAGLLALRERDEAIKRWLVDDVARAYDAMKAAPNRAIPAKEVFSELRRRQAPSPKRGY